MTQNKNLMVIGLVLLGLLIWSSMFIVDQRERAILFRLGEIVHSDFAPGLHFKIPVINNVRKFDGRILTMDSQPERYLTSEKKNVIVDSFVKWRIKDVATFYRSTGGDERLASTRLSQIIRTCCAPSSPSAPSRRWSPAIARRSWMCSAARPPWR